MKIRTIGLGVSVLAVVGAIFVGASRGSVSVGGDATVAPATGRVDANDPAVQAIVRAEVAKQLRPAVEQEVKRQLTVLIRQAQAEARPRALESTLQTIRSQLELYKIQHEDDFPTMGQLEGWKVLRNHTDSKGNCRDGLPFGPYVRYAPVNPYTGKTDIVAAGHATAEAGWTWDEKKEELRAVLPAMFEKELGELGETEVEFLK